MEQLGDPSDQQNVFSLKARPCVGMDGGWVGGCHGGCRAEVSLLVLRGEGGVAKCRPGRFAARLCAHFVMFPAVEPTGKLAS